MTDEKPKRQYNYSYAHKAKMASRKAVKAKEKEIARLKKNLENKTRRLRDKKETLKVVQNAETNKETKKGLVIEEDKLDTLPSPVKKLIEEEKERIVFKPNKGPQTDFLAAPEQDVLYGGSAGGGKSYAMLVDPLRFMHIKEHRALLLRKSMPELRELIDKSRELYPKAFKGAKFREVEKIWRFPSGASLEFGYLDRDADVYRYQGQSYTWIGIDELTQYPTEFPLQYLQSRLRTTNNEIQCFIRCTANPGGVGGSWVKKRYLDPSPPNESFIGQDKITRKFIPAKLDDNPYLAEDGKYERMLESLPPVQKKQLLEGDQNFSSSGGDVFKLALYTSSATLNSATTSFTTTNEVANTGTYASGGDPLAGQNTSIASGVAIVDFADLSFTGVTLTARGAMIYNTSSAVTNAAVAILDFGADKTATSGTFTIQFPAFTTAAAILRISG